MSMLKHHMYGHIQYTYDTGKVEDLQLVDKSSDYTTNNKLEKVE